MLKEKEFDAVAGAIEFRKYTNGCTQIDIRDIAGRYVSIIQCPILNVFMHSNAWISVCAWETAEMSSQTKRNSNWIKTKMLCMHKQMADIIWNSWMPPSGHTTSIYTIFAWMRELRSRRRIIKIAIDRAWLMCVSLTADDFMFSGPFHTYSIKNVESRNYWCKLTVHRHSHNTSVHIFQYELFFSLIQFRGCTHFRPIMCSCISKHLSSIFFLFHISSLIFFRLPRYMTLTCRTIRLLGIGEWSM